MKTRLISFSLILAILLAGCGPAAQTISETPVQTHSPAEPTATPSVTPDTQATVDAAVMLTNQAQSEIQATVDSAVLATVEAEQIEEPVPESEVEQSEDVEDAVNDLETITDDIDEYLLEALLDEALSDEEIDELEVLIADALIMLDYALYLADVYDYYYAYLTPEEIQELYALIEDMEEIEVLLNDLLALVEDGDLTADEIIAEMETLANDLLDLADLAQVNVGQWQTDVQAVVENRLSQLENIQANLIAADRNEAISMAYDYFDGIRDALADGQVSLEEWEQIAQLGANAVAGLQTQGGPKLSNLADNINQLSTFVASGQLGQLENQLLEFTTNLPTLP